MLKIHHQISNQMEIFLLLTLSEEEVTALGVARCGGD